MKRLRDDVITSHSQVKRPFVSQPYAQPHVPGDKGVGEVAGGAGSGAGAVAGVGGGAGGVSNQQKPTTNDALMYLKQVEDMFHDQKEKYAMFCGVLKDFGARRIDVTGVIARVKELFKGHNYLIFGFNTFLPKRYEITVIEEDRPPPKIKVGEMAGGAGTGPGPVAAAGVGGGAGGVSNQQKPTRNDALMYLKQVEDMFHDQKEKYAMFCGVTKDFGARRIDIAGVIARVKELFKGHNNLIFGFNMFLPKGSEITVVEEDEPLPKRKVVAGGGEAGAVAGAGAGGVSSQQKDTTNAASMFVEQVVDVFHDQRDKTTIKLQKEQRKGSEKESRDWTTPDQYYKEPDLEGHNNLIVEINTFLPKGSEITVIEEDEPQPKRKVGEVAGGAGEGAVAGAGAGGGTGGVSNQLKHTTSDASTYVKQVIDVFHDQRDKTTTEGHVSKSGRTEKKEREHKRGKYNVKYWTKSIQELDLSDRQCSTPSYRMLPDDYPIPSVSQRSELGAQVLNDLWVCVTSGNSDYSFTHRRNQYEECLFRCEDDRFELDMLLESVISTAKRAVGLLNSINKTISPEIPLRIEEHFSALNLRCMERLYGDHGLDAIENLRQNLSVALPVMSTRLKQKQEEWTKCKADFNKVWADIYANYHYKSLDHRSFCFK